MNLTFSSTELPDVILIHSSSFEDERGWLRETYNKNEFYKNGIVENFIQEKNSFSKPNVLRGLHLQREPKGQGKLVRCIYGSIFDVVVDVRVNSLTYGKWIGVELTDSNGYQLYIPPGFAHGFVVTSNTGAWFNYHITHNDFSKEYDGGVFFNDKTIGIKWPIDIDQMIISEKDKILPTLTQFIQYEVR